MCRFRLGNTGLAQCVGIGAYTLWLHGEGVSMAQTKPIYREEVLERISSPEQLTSYLRVTNPGVWMVLIGVIMLLVGLIAWSTVGTLETTAPATIMVEDNLAHVAFESAEPIEGGVSVRVHDQEYAIDYVSQDVSGMTAGEAKVDLPDGRYSGVVVLERVHPIQFLLESR